MRETSETNLLVFNGSGRGDFGFSPLRLDVAENDRSNRHLQMREHVRVA
jgi:hypothetical protein